MLNPELSGAYNFGPNSNDTASVRSIIGLAQQVYSGGQTAFSEEDTGPHEADSLLLEIAKARSSLSVVPQWSLKEAVSRTLLWYKSFYKGSNAYELCERDLIAYEGK